MGQRADFWVKIEFWVKAPERGFAVITLEKVRDADYTLLPEYEGEFFAPLTEGDMKRVDLSTFFKFGKNISDLRALDGSDKLTDFAVFQLVTRVSVWILFFLGATNDVSLSHTRDIAESIRKLLSECSNRCKVAFDEGDKDEMLGEPFIRHLTGLLDEFDVLFTRESRKINVFAISPVGIYDIEKLIESADKRFPQNLLKVMPELTVNDLKEAGKCLAFELPTACAFHICRATEALMLAYYEKATGKSWPFAKRDWGMYVNQLKTLPNVPKAITDRLWEIREDRNSYTHPDITVPLDEALVVFELCNNVIHMMAKEIEKIEAAKAAASSSPPTP